MFSGLTNQMSSWMGSTGKKQDGEIQKIDDELQQSTPVEDAGSGIDLENKKDSSPTKGSRLDMLGNLGSVKSQMSGWLSGGIPGLRKTDTPGAEGTEGVDVAQGVESPASQQSVKGSPVEKEDDNSRDTNEISMVFNSILKLANQAMVSLKEELYEEKSKSELLPEIATGSADSEAHASEEGTPIDDKEGAQNFGAVSTKALQGAKNIGSFLFSAVNKAGKTVSEASAKIKKTVEENSLLGEFNKEQEAFIKEKQGKNGDVAVPPWVGYTNEENLKEECLSLSTDRRNFVRSPPAGVEFHFDFETTQPVAMATLAEDPNLEKMRFELVPKMISEENFWRNYFYRVSLICQTSELNSMAQEGGGSIESRAATQGDTA
uniref:BSD domain-containing protein n=1 Tax=Clastoptera arizonana TaxID=38151 RepID=A0A1B6CPZ5_9HEMI